MNQYPESIPKTETYTKQKKGSLQSEISKVYKNAEHLGQGILGALKKLHDNSQFNTDLGSEMHLVKKLLGQLSTATPQTPTEVQHPKKNTKTPINPDTNYSPRRSQRQIAEQMIRERKSSHKTERALLDSDGIQGDKNHIEGRNVELIYGPDTTTFTFKLTTIGQEYVNSQALPYIPPENKSTGKYEFISSNNDTIPMGDATTIQVSNDIVIQISHGGEVFEVNKLNYDKPIKDAYGNTIDYEKETTKETRPILTLRGAVKIVVRNTSNPEEIIHKAEEALKLLKLEDALDLPESHSDDEYIKARVMWHEKITSSEEYEEYKKYQAQKYGQILEQQLHLEEIFPGYTTVVHDGLSEQLKKDGRFILTHRLYEMKNIGSILQAGLLSSYERYKRGGIISGSSTHADFLSGGADSVFLRFMPEKSEYGPVNPEVYATTLIINPKTLDRTDWYAYHSDNYGSTGAPFSDRIPASQVPQLIRKFYSDTNEIMFRKAIPPEDIFGIVVRSIESKTKLVDYLHSVNITTLNGKPIEECIFLCSNNQEIFSKMDIK